MPQADPLIQAVQKATRTLARTGNVDELLPEVLRICVEAVGASGGTIYVHDPTTRRLAFQHVLPESVRDRLPMLDIPDDYGSAGEAFQQRHIVTREFPERSEAELSDFERATGVTLTSMMCVPLQMEDEEPIGVVQLVNKAGGPFTTMDQAVIDTVAAVCTMAVLNSRLTEESTRSSSLLGMGKVSHDIGNLAASLYATIGYAEHIVAGMKTSVRDSDVDAMEAYVDSMDGLFGEVQASVERIVGYSRLISDLSAGRDVRPNMRSGELAPVVTMAAAYLETEARSNRVALKYEIANDACEAWFDELFVFRIVQNLVGNAIKAVRETLPESFEPFDELNPSYLGEVIVRYRVVEGEHEISVCDTGPGMDRRVADRILSGRSRSQWGKGSGSGWGLKIVLELVAAHGGNVSILSEPGKGATFFARLPGSRLD